MTSYGELLRDPRWQRKRLEIMQRDGFGCAECRSATRTLNVHHRYYEKGRAPWEYPDAAFVTLCEDCHERAEVDLAEIRKLGGFLNATQRDALVPIMRAMVDRVSPAPAPITSSRIGPRRAQWKMLDSPPPPIPQ
jgi:hypothetical protein